MKKFNGEAEVDESYFGPTRIRGKRGRGAGFKLPVIGLLKRNDKVIHKDHHQLYKRRALACY